MTAFAEDVAAQLGTDFDTAEVNAVLTSAGVRPAGAMPIPHQLKLERLMFAGVKPWPGEAATDVLPTDTDPGAAESLLVIDEDTGAAPTRPVPTLPTATVDGSPFEFVWLVDAGLYGVGSHENFRGKSSVLEIVLWALRGRCGLQADVRRMVHRVELDFCVDDEPLRVRFDDVTGQPVGGVVRRSGNELELATFTSATQFEAAMGELMMSRLGLTPIPAWQSSPGKADGQPVSHSWAAYAGALFVADASLDNLLGDTSFSGLAGRLLHMFVGTPWASTMVEAQVAARQAQQELDAARRRATSDAAARVAERDNLAEQLEQARARLAELPDVSDPDTVASLVEDASSAAMIVTSLRGEHAAAVAEIKGLRGELNTAKARRLDLIEDALARRFFNSISPTACPRCAAPVTAERLQGEREAQCCSVCTSGLDLELYAQEVIVAASAPTDERADALTAAALSRADGTNPLASAVDDSGEDEEQPVDELAALTSAVDAAEQRRAQLAERLGEAESTYARLREPLAAASHARTAARMRQAAELVVARLEGALGQAQRTAGLTQDGPAEALTRRFTVLQTAEKLAKKRVSNAQTAMLSAVGEEVLRLGRAFGIEALERVVLRGNATLEVHKGGVKTSYSKCTRGEKLRLKVATALALLRVGFSTGVGRHPGLLLVDSPGAEEATPENLDSMLVALRDVATEVPHLQVLVATRSPLMLEELLDPTHRRVAGPGEYLW